MARTLFEDDKAGIALLATTHGNPPLRGLPFSAIKQEILGETYELTVIFIGRDRSRALNRAFRDKDKPADVLSFPLDANTGEVFICPERARRDAARFGRTPRQFIGYLFIHGCLHLKGYDHGRTMERYEAQVRERHAL